MSKKLELDTGMENGLDAYFATPAQDEKPAAPATAKTPPVKKSSLKKEKKRSLLTNKSGLYFSDAIMKRLDKEFSKQPWNNKKSKSQIVEEILRQHWGLPPLDDE
jgi:hypothetical protein